MENQSLGSVFGEKSYKFLLPDSDSSMGEAWKNNLLQAGFDVGNNPGYPALRTREELVKAINYLWQSRVGGWRLLADELRENGIATDEELIEAL